MGVPNTPENMKRCVCGDCPTYDACMGAAMEGLFCSRGVSACDVRRQGCICGGCPVYAEYGVDGSYFCVEGAAS